MREGTARTSTRWGGREEKQVAGGTTVELSQFADMKLLAPQQLSLALYAVTDAPIAGIAVDWTVQIGCGSFNHVEKFSVSVSDIVSQVPVVLLRQASSVQVTATIRSGVPETKTVKCIVNIVPSSPSWRTDLSCTEEVG